MVILTGCKGLDELIEYYEDGIITLIYGPGASGKTTLCLQCAADLAKNNKKTIYLSTEGEFSVDRLIQILGDEYVKYLDNILIIKINDFNDQKENIQNLENLVKAGKISLIIVDSFTNFYRLELRDKKGQEINKEIASQLTILKEIAKNHFIPVLITNQVSDDLKTGYGVKNVGGKFVENFCKCVIELKNYGVYRELMVKKHKEGEFKKMKFEIRNEGIVKI
ncbi:MAG: DNA repair and recombination protein RadB [Candidatus Woesearchaeota archaeon]|nr:MAG: DNA repair and recombination protein RadB [Candidatus Woesearchaeota archaeon]